MLGTPSNIYSSAVSSNCAKFGTFVNSVTILKLRDLTKRGYISINGKMYHGVFRNIRGVAEVGIGLAMAIHGAEIDIENTAEDNPWRSLAVLALARNQNERLTEGDIGVY